MRFYVYVLARPNGEPFYVGKGSGNRIDDREREARAGHRCHKCNIIRKVWGEGGQVQRSVVFETDDEQEAFDRERQLIAFYGRDALANHTDGGEGFANLSAEARAKIRASLLGHDVSPQTREKIGAAHRGRSLSLEHRQKMAASRTGKTLSDEHRASLSAAMKGKRPSAATIEASRRAHAGRPLSDEHRTKLKGRPSNFTPRVRAAAAAARRRLTSEQAQDIRHIYAAGSASQPELARRYGVSQATVWGILNNRVYKEHGHE